MAPESPARVILVDDDPQSRREAGCVLRRAGLIVHACQEAGEALVALAHGPRPDAVVSHARLRGTSGLALLLAVHVRDSRLPVVLTSRFVSVPMAAEAIREGAFDFTAWPFRDAARGRAGGD